VCHVCRCRARCPDGWWAIAHNDRPSNVVADSQRLCLLPLFSCKKSLLSSVSSKSQTSPRFLLITSPHFLLINFFFFFLNEESFLYLMVLLIRMFFLLCRVLQYFFPGKSLTFSATVTCGVSVAVCLQLCARKKFRICFQNTLKGAFG
jgi:hypothetical protein